MKETPAARRGAQLGELEAEVMSEVWQRGAATVHDVTAALQAHRPLAYTTVMTVMSRLADKGLLERTKEGRAFIYRPATSRDELAGSMLSNLVRRLYAGSSGAAIAHLIEADEDVDEGELKRLEAMIRAKREEIKS